MKNTNGKIKVHDSIIKELLESKEEFRDCISSFIGYEIEKEKIELQNKEYRIRDGLSTRIMDILYKVLGKEVFIIVEHQSTVDQKMPERMGEYCLLLVKSREKYLEKGKNKRIPIILPIVLSTANKEWNATTTLIEKEKDNCYGFPKQKYPRYKVINNYDYTIDELIEKRTGIGLVMAYEKVENKEELRYIIKKQKEKGVNEREKNAMKLIVEHIEEVMPSLAKKLTEEEIKEIKEEMRKIMEGSDFMTNFESISKNNGGK